MIFKKHSSMVMAGDGASVHPKAVRAVVPWAVAPTESEREAGVEGSESMEVSVHVQPELKLPTRGDNGV